VSCAIITAVHAFHRSRAVVGETAIVAGIGGIGIVQIQILEATGCKVVAISRSRQNLDLALQAGANLAVTPAESADKVLSLTEGKGADLAIDMVGVATTMRNCGDLLCIRGRLVIVGEEDECPPVNTIQIAQRELEIIGSRNGGIDDAREAIALIADGIVKPHVDRVMSLDRINAAMDYVRAGKAHGWVVIRVRED